jgi:hypothetical protein
MLIFFLFLILVNQLYKTNYPIILLCLKKIFKKKLIFVNQLLRIYNNFHSFEGDIQVYSPFPEKILQYFENVRTYHLQLLTIPKHM